MIFIATGDEAYSLNPLWVCEGDSRERAEARDGVAGKIREPARMKKYDVLTRSPWSLNVCMDKVIFRIRCRFFFFILFLKLVRINGLNYVKREVSCYA